MSSSSRRSSELAGIIRYYQAGVINTAFGFGIYALLVWWGLNIFFAQVLAHLIGMAFNYLTYSRHAFRGSAPVRLRFVVAYAVNYGLSVATLALASLVIGSPYLAGLVAIVIVSLINYFVLKQFVFFARVAE